MSTRASGPTRKVYTRPTETNGQRNVVYGSAEEPAAARVCGRRVRRGDQT